MRFWFLLRVQNTQMKHFNTTKTSRNVTSRNVTLLQWKKVFCCFPFKFFSFNSKGFNLTRNAYRYFDVIKYITATQRNKRRILYLSKLLNNPVFGKETDVGFKLTKTWIRRPWKMHFRVTRSQFNGVVSLERHDMVETLNSSWYAICRTAFRFWMIGKAIMF